MQRFFFPELSFGTDIVICDDAFVHQISRVLRFTAGASIVLFNGDGKDYLYTIDSIHKKEIGLSYGMDYINTCDSEKIIRLYQSMPNKYDKIEYILQKGVEVGIREFVFFRSERSQKLMINDHKMERFREIVREATEQCGGCHVAPVSFREEGIHIPKEGTNYILHTETLESQKMRDISIGSEAINIFIGPEGGWSAGEVSYFQKQAFQKICLGDRILRTETAGSVVAFFLIHQ